jgi:hypothetical protein
MKKNERVEWDSEFLEPTLMGVSAQPHAPANSYSGREFRIPLEEDAG